MKMTLEEVSQRIEKWHDLHFYDSTPLHEYLGWTREQYADWVETGEIPEEDRCPYKCGSDDPLCICDQMRRQGR